MFINTKKTIKIVSDNGTEFSAKAGWIGEIPQWVEKHWYFKALCKDGTITSIVSAKDKDIQAALELPKSDEPPAPPELPALDNEPPAPDGGDNDGGETKDPPDGGEAVAVKTGTGKKK